MDFKSDNMCPTGKKLMNHHLLKTPKITTTSTSIQECDASRKHNFRRRFKKSKCCNIYSQNKRRPVVLKIKYQLWQSQQQDQQLNQNICNEKNIELEELKLLFSSFFNIRNYNSSIKYHHSNVNTSQRYQKRIKKRKTISYDLLKATKNRYLKENIKRRKNFTHFHSIYNHKTSRNSISSYNINNNNNHNNGRTKNLFSEESDCILDKYNNHYIHNNNEYKSKKFNSNDLKNNEELQNVIICEINNNNNVNKINSNVNREFTETTTIENELINKENLVKFEKNGSETKKQKKKKQENNCSKNVKVKKNISNERNDKIINERSDMKFIETNECEIKNVKEKFENIESENDVVYDKKLNDQNEENNFVKNNAKENEEKNSQIDELHLETIKEEQQNTIRETIVNIHEENDESIKEEDQEITVEEEEDTSTEESENSEIQEKEINRKAEANKEITVEEEEETKTEESENSEIQEKEVNRKAEASKEIIVEEENSSTEENENSEIQVKGVNWIEEENTVEKEPTAETEDEHEKIQEKEIEIEIIQNKEELCKEIEKVVIESNEIQKQHDTITLNKELKSKLETRDEEERIECVEDDFDINFINLIIENVINEYDHNRLIGQQQQQQQNGNIRGSGTTINGTINPNRIKDSNNSTVIVATNTSLSVCNGNSPTSGSKLRNGNVNSTNTTAASNHGSPNNSHKKHLQSQQQPGQQSKNLQSQHYQKQHQEQQKHQQQQQQKQQQQQISQQEQLQQQLNTTKNTSKTSLLNLSIPEGNKSVEALGVLLQYLVYDLDAFACPSIKQNYDYSQKNLLQAQSMLDDARTTCHNLQDQIVDKEHYYMTREQELQDLHRCELTKVETSLIDFQTNANERIAILESDLLRKDEEQIKKIESIQQQSELKIQQLEKDLQRSRSNEIDLLKRIEILTLNENELRDRIQDNEDSFSERLQANVQRERDLNDKIASLSKQFELARLEAEKRERELEEKFNLSQNELTVIRSNQSLLVTLNNSNNTSANNIDEIKIKSPKTVHGNNGGNGGNCGGGGGSSVMSLSMSSSNNSNKVQMLENEVESLRSVMDIKLNDICELRKKNQELTRANEEFESLKIKYSGMDSRLEDLQIQLRAKDEEKQELLSKIKHLQETCAQEAKNRTRVVLHNEELQYRLKQNSEKFNALVAELSKTDYMSSSKGSYSLNPENQDLSQNSSLISCTNASIRTNGGGPIPGLTFEEEDDSPPGSPIIKGVVKKSDSVSWVLQMDDESPEVVASRMVKRAGSFRSSFNEKLQNAKRQLSLPAGPTNSNGTHHSINAPGINPLQQSASATMVNIQNQSSLHQRQHSISESEYGTISTPRVRSKSVIIKGCDQKKQLKQNPSIVTSKKIDTLTSWKEPICSSSPYARHAIKFQKASHSPPKVSTLPSNVMKHISKSYSQDDEDEEDTSGLVINGAAAANNSVVNATKSNIFSRKNSRHLITCDPSVLTTNERLEMRQAISSAIPSHSSVQDLKTLKKSQPQIQESAGEAMVSGTNSEDESCSGSSDESPCQSQSISSNTNSSSSNSSDHPNKLNSNALAIEEALLMDKIAGSLDGTPMEVSWSSDAEVFPPESIV